MKFKREIFVICLMLCLLRLNSQHGLENIIVEKYYISNSDDTLSPLISGFLPVGSVTYRIFLDMLPEYRFHAAYGNQNHELKFETTTQFFNNIDIGNTAPNVIPRRALNRNTVMLDSWLSAGAAGENYYGILKEEDDTLETVLHEGKFLRNRNKLAGIPLSVRDGLKAGVDVPFPSFFGIDSIVSVFYTKSNASLFSTRNGAWGCLGGSVGPDSLSNNRVLIAQITTNGELTFELNIQIGKRGFAPENYVAKNALGNEIAMPFLTYNSRTPKAGTSKNNKSVQANTNPSLK